MCYTGICKYENYNGDCRASSVQLASDCFLCDEADDDVNESDEFVECDEEDDDE